MVPFKILYSYEILLILASLFALAKRCWHQNLGNRRKRKHGRSACWKARGSVESAKGSLYMHVIDRTGALYSASCDVVTAQ